ncbi:HD domain-containing protein [Patescibacteria group bacterium]|nr:HD domain-containing protein [Patescibacteria group bacterium]
MLTLSEVKKNPQILEFIKETEKTLAALFYTDHGLRHANLTADRARNIAKEIGLSKKDQELAAVASFCHDMANFISRSHHNYFGALLFHQVLSNNFEPKEMTDIMQAISNHDKDQEDMSFANPISAVVVLADKSDVHRSRVIVKKMEDIRADIHDRVNYATKECRLKIDKAKKNITLTLKIDTSFVPIMEYFEIFTDRMVFCRLAAEYLNYNFGLVINSFRLL